VLRDAFNHGQERHLIRYALLSSGEAFYMDYYHADWEYKNLTVPGESRVNDLLFSAEDPYDTGRPIRILFGPKPDDGGAVLLSELGGFAVAGTSSTA